ncbi:MAG TPA: WbqC family protein [Puia sp.]|nr:WbqC family protein [Puia sp.]
MKLLTDLHYFPSIIFYKYSYKYSNIIFDQYESYQKMSFRNRCMIAGANGIISLSVPLQEGRNQKTMIKDVRIAGLQWQAQHWKSIMTSYNKSPWFEFYKDELKLLYSKSFHFLLDWNIACFEWSAQKLKLPLTFSLTDNLQNNQQNETEDFRNKVLPKNYLSFDAVRYRQVFEDKIGFLPNLSVLDLLFCEGKNAIALLRK